MKDPMYELCPPWSEKLVALHPDDLSPRERTELEDHVANCPVCSAIRAEYRQMDAHICNFPDPEFLLHLSAPLLKLCKVHDADS